MLAGYLFASIGSLGLQYSYGALYSEMLRALHAGRAETAFVGSLSMGLMDGLAVASEAVIQRLGYRRTCLLGAVVSFAGLALSAAATTLWHLYLSYGLLLGVGHSLSFISGVLSVPQWFTTRAARVNAVANGGAGLMAFLVGPLIVPLVGSVGWRNTLLCLAGVDLVLLVLAAAFLQEPAKGEVERTAPFAKPAAAGQGSTTTAETEDSTTAETEAASAAAVAVVASSESDNLHGRRRRCRLPDFLMVARRQPVQVLIVVTILWGMGGWIPIVHLSELGRERGLNDDEAARLLIWLATGSVAMRLPIATLADLYGRRRAFVVVLLGCVLANGLVAPANVTSSAALSAYAAVEGGLIGAANSLLVSVPSELCYPLPETRSIISLLVTVLGFSFMVGPTIAASVRDASGGYMGAFALSAALMFGAVLAMCVSLRQTSPPKLLPKCRTEKVPADGAPDEATDSGVTADDDADSVKVEQG